MSSELDLYLESSLFRDYGPNGLQIEGKNEIKKLAFSVSADLDSINLAINWKADGLIVHHGLFWKFHPMRTITGPYGKRIKSLVENNINLWGFHLPLDAHPVVGNAAYIAKLLDLQNQESFFGDDKFPLGIKGELASPLSVVECRKILEEKLHHNVIVNADLNDSSVKCHKIGIVTGAASEGYKWACRDGLDSFITGEMKENAWHDAKEANIIEFACGHHASEKGGVLQLMNLLKEKYPKLDVCFFDSPNLA